MKSVTHTTIGTWLFPQEPCDRALFCGICGRSFEVEQVSSPKRFAVVCRACSRHFELREWSMESVSNFHKAGGVSVEICVLFVAHNGVHQPRLWLDWARAAQNVRFAVLCNDEVDHQQPFCEHFRVLGAHTNSQGGCNTLDWVLDAIGWLTRRTPLKWMIIVSGTSVPLRSLEEFQQELMKNETHSTLDAHRMHQAYEIETFRRGLCPAEFVKSALTV